MSRLAYSTVLVVEESHDCEWNFCVSRVLFKIRVENRWVVSWWFKLDSRQRTDFYPNFFERLRWLPRSSLKDWNNATRTIVGYCSSLDEWIDWPSLFTQSDPRAGCKIWNFPRLSTLRSFLVNKMSSLPLSSIAEDCNTLLTQAKYNDLRVYFILIQDLPQSWSGG
jgi:hypothetical protein